MSADDLKKRPGARSQTRFLLRLPPQMLSHIDAAARANYRTRTAEIQCRLEASIEGESIDEHGVIVRLSTLSSK